jgi:hypothetical protein
MDDREVRGSGPGPMIYPPQAPAVRRERSALEQDLPEDGVRIRVRPLRRTTRLAVGLASLAGLLAAGLWAAVGAELTPMLLASLVLGSTGGLVWCATRGMTAYVAFDRHGIHDAAADLPPLAWPQIERLEIVAESRGTGQALLVHPASGPGILLPGTAEAGLPIPFEYLVVQLHRRGAPIREPDPAFDAFGCDVRWLPAPRAASLIADHLGARARPYAGQQLDIAETRDDRPGVHHWRLVLESLRERAGQVPAED